MADKLGNNNNLIETGKTVIFYTAGVYNYSYVESVKLVTATMFYKKCCRQITSRKWILIHSLCSLIFILHITLMGLFDANPEHTVSSKMKMKLLETEHFPVVFKLCIKPGGYDLGKLNQFGYQTATHYFYGRSLYNSSLVGWAGHREDGTVMSTAEGNLCQH